MGLRETARLTMKNVLIMLAAAGLLLAAFTGAAALTPLPSQVDKPGLGANFLVSDTDLYCSFFILDTEPPLKITGSDDGRTLLADGDRVMLAGRGLAGLQAGQILSVLEIGPKVAGLGRKPSPGWLAFQRGRVRVLSVEGGGGSARIERTCGSLMPGCVLLPFVEKAKFQVKESAFASFSRSGDVPAGRVLYVEDNAVQIATDQRALIDLGRNDGLDVGRQLTVFAAEESDRTPEPSANAVVIDVGRSSATVKLLTSKIPVHIGDLVQIK
jgi:hypothetical protein